MGATHVTATIRNMTDRDRSCEGLFLVDTGAIDSLVPRLTKLPAVRLKGVRRRP